MRPLLITTTRSASSSASSWSWVTNTVVWPVLVVDFAQPAAEVAAHLGVQGAERLVEQEHARLDGERSGEGDALPLAAGELRRIALLKPESWTRSSSSTHRRRISLQLGGASPAARVGRSDIVGNGHVAEQRVVAGTRARPGALAPSAEASSSIEEHPP